MAGISLTRNVDNVLFPCQRSPEGVNTACQLIRVPQVFLTPAIYPHGSVSALYRPRSFSSSVCLLVYIHLVREYIMTHVV